MKNSRIQIPKVKSAEDNWRKGADKESFSLMKTLTHNLFVMNIITIFFLIISPFFLYRIFIDKQYTEFIKDLSPGMDINKVAVLAIDRGFDVSGGNAVESIFTETEICNVSNFELIEGGVGIDFGKMCGTLEITMNYQLLNNFIMFSIGLSATVFVLVLINNMVNLHYIRRKIKSAFVRVNKEITRIEELRSWTDNETEENFEEFEEVFNNIRRVNKELSRYNEEKHTLVSSLSHELKSPINKINSLIQAYEYELPGYTDEKKMTKTIKEEIMVMNDILNYSLEIFLKTRVKSERSVSPRELVADIVSHKSDELNLRKIQVTYIEPTPVRVMTDINTLRLVLSNLVENVTKYAKTNSLVEITITENGFKIENDIDETRETGTQQGLKLSSELISSSGGNLQYFNAADKFVVIIEFNI